MTDGLGVDTGFDTIGSEKTALQAIDAVAAGGRAVRVGILAFATRRR
jgi:threonine dehydrogenase-like Zn-dependent dehydrogenase